MSDSTTTDIVLVVDDSPESLSLINDTLEQAGISVLVALEGKQALAIANKLKPDLILMDAVMPHMDGFETCERLKQDPKFESVPVIFMTGLTDKKSTVQGLELGAVDYLTKPVDPNELLARIKTHLKNARLTKSAYQALDSTGQYLFTSDRQGHVAWATPQTHALFAKAKITDEWKNTVLAQQLGTWFSHDPSIGQSFKLEGTEHALQVTLVALKTENEYLLKLSDTKTVSGEAALKEGLGLTKRESQVLYWLAKGKTNRDVAQILEMSPRTVNKHLEQIYPKLGVENRTSAAAIALKILQ
ncbi:MAG: response regulator transcription factor [Agarilytica sp.]